MAFQFPKRLTKTLQIRLSPVKSKAVMQSIGKTDEVKLETSI
jgi:hypothetical protein